MTPAKDFQPETFTLALFAIMQRINPGLQELEPYEFRYCLNNLFPEPGGWESVVPAPAAELERQVNDPVFYGSLQVKPRARDRIILDERITHLAQMLFVGLVSGAYREDWVNAHFYFDIRGFYFLHRTQYFNDRVIAHLGGAPFRTFEAKQKQFETSQGIGYKAFKAANEEIDRFFMDSVCRLVAWKGTPIVVAIAGPTAAGKTEIVERLHAELRQHAWNTTSIEMDNFLTDRDQREAKGIHSLGREAIHFELFQHSLIGLCQGKKVQIPRYDFIFATSSHHLDGRLKPGAVPVEIEPAEVIFIEGNFPFLIEEVVPLIGIKAVYLTDDPIRLKRKWVRDIDYRKKYEPTYFRNRFFKEQYLMAQKCYLPQMEACDLLIDTTGAAVWATPEVVACLSPDESV